MSDTKRDSNRLAVLKTYKLYINGKFPRSESGRDFSIQLKGQNQTVHLSQASRKDFRDAVTAARAAQPKWSEATAYNRGQILYRISEILEGRKSQFLEELIQQGFSEADADQEVSASIDRCLYYAGWSDKYQQVFSSVNPVASSHFNFSVFEPTGVVAIVAPEESPLLGLISVLAPALVGGNAAVLLASSKFPLTAITFAEVLHSSDVPSGVVNILTGFKSELLKVISTHMDVNVISYCGSSADEIKTLQEGASLNLKRLQVLKNCEWFEESVQNPYMILDLQEVKTTWHPVGH